MTSKERFIEIYKKCIKREGADKLLDYLISSDFFTAPASARFHSSYEGGLCEHSLNVYDCLKRIASNYEDKRISAESIAIAALFHDVCKVNFYKTEYRNVKVDGQWTQVPYYSIEDTLPYGHGEKSVYIISGFMRLTREEAMAINWHSGGFDDRVRGGSFGMSQAYYKFPTAMLFHSADMMATYLDEKA